IDLYSRMAYAEIHSRVLPGLAARTIVNAQRQFGISFSMVQSDNGPEFGRYFEQVLRCFIQTAGTKASRMRLIKK
ncbi:hypothetical protein CR983_01870, partial [Candidatus Saccharibacteria bacterium]